MTRVGSTPISRRDAITHLVLTVGGSSLLHACGGRVELDSLTPGPTPLFYTDREMAVLSRVSDLLLPRTETPGALDVQVPAVLDRLLTEWASRERQAEHRALLATLDAALHREAEGDVLDAPAHVAEEALAAVDAAAFSGTWCRGVPVAQRTHHAGLLRNGSRRPPGARMGGGPAPLESMRGTVLSGRGHAQTGRRVELARGEGSHG